MMRLLAQTPALLALLLATIAMTIAFALLPGVVGGPLLDSLLTAEAARDRIAAMSAGQRNAHILITTGLDTAYPIAYGGLLAGLALRFGKAPTALLVLPAAAAMTADYLENIVQALALAGDTTLLPAKSALTPMKFVLVLAASSLTALLAAGYAPRRWKTHRA